MESSLVIKYWDIYLFPIFTIIPCQASALPHHFPCVSVWKTFELHKWWMQEFVFSLFFWLCLSSWEAAAVVQWFSLVPSQQEGSGFESHAFYVVFSSPHAWVYSRCPSFLPHTKNLNIVETLKLQTLNCAYAVSTVCEWLVCVLSWTCDTSNCVPASRVHHLLKGFVFYRYRQHCLVHTADSTRNEKNRNGVRFGHGGVFGCPKKCAHSHTDVYTVTNQEKLTAVMAVWSGLQSVDHWSAALSQDIVNIRVTWWWRHQRLRVLWWSWGSRVNRGSLIQNSQG